MKNKLLSILSLVLLVSLIAPPVMADADDTDPRLEGLAEPQVAVPEVFGDIEKADSFIVVLEDDSLVTYQGGVTGFPATSPRITGEDLDVESIPSTKYLGYLQRVQSGVIAAAEATLDRGLDVTHRYEVVLNGFAAKMTPLEAGKLAQLDGVKAVYADELWQPQTDVSPEYLGADTLWDDSDSTPGSLETRGEGMLVGILDTGINMDHPSFAATSGDGYTHTNPFGTEYKGLCATDPTNFVCNDKLVGVYAYTQGDETLYGEDAHAHGSHTASTAAGNYLETEYDGVSVEISGMAPRANIIAYDVCHPGGCPNSYSVDAVEQAVVDGVDVLNYSIGPNSAVNPYDNAVELAMLEAVEAGVLTSTSAGNAGPDPSTIYKAPAWSMNVANITHGRIFGNHVNVHGYGGGDAEVYGATALPGSGLPFSSDLEHYPLLWAGDDDPANVTGCTAFSADYFDGAVALISRGDCSFADKIDNADAAGAVAALIYNNLAGPPIVMGACEGTTIPSAMLDKEDGDAIVALLASDPMLVTVDSETESATKSIWADIVAQGSSRGPFELLDILTPDVGAPGTNVLAAYNTPGATAPFGGVGTDTEIDLMSGTSMASPHGAGSALLLMSLFPGWTPIEIKSAIMMSAYNDTMVKEDGVTPADPFDTGNGRIDLTKAALIGLVMDETVANFQAADPATGGDVKTLNIPSYQNSQCVGNCSFTRTVRNVADVATDYTVVVDAPTGVTITPSLTTFNIEAGETQAIEFEVDVSGAEMGTWKFASITFETDDTFTTSEPITDARFQLAVMPDAGNLPGLIEKDVYRDAGGVLLEDLYSIEITDLTVETAGLTEADLLTFEVAGDPTNGDPYDQLGDVWYTSFTTPADTKRVVMEIVDTMASDLDLFFGYGTTPMAATQLGSSATGASFEYLSFIDPPAGDYWVLVQNWGGDPATLEEFTLAWALVPDTPSTNFEVSGPAGVPALDEFDLEVTWDIPEMEAFSAWYGWFSLGSDAGNPGNVGETEVNLYRPYDDVTKEVDVAETENLDVITYTISIEPNRTGEDLFYEIYDALPDGLTYVPDSVATNGSATMAIFDDVENAIRWEGTVPTVAYNYVASTPSTNPYYCDTPFGGGYLDLKPLGVKPLAGLEGDSIFFSLDGFGVGQEYFGKTILSGPTFTSDGYFYMGPYTDWWFWSPQQFPDPTVPNNIVAPWMYDMVIEFEAETKGVGAASWGSGALWAIQFDDVFEFDNPDVVMDYQIWSWRDLDPSEGWPDLVVAFDNVSGGWSPFGSIGLENEDGTLGTSFAFMDYVPASGDIICFDYAETNAEPVVITFEAVVETTVEKDVENIVDHEADGLGMKQEEASATFHNTPNLKPIADPQSLTTEEEVPLALTLTGSLLNPGPVIWEVVSGPSNGTLTGSGTDWIYTPDDDFYGTDQFDFIVNDGLEDSDPATVVIEVTNVNDEPVAGDDEYGTDFETVLDVPAPGVMANDYDADPTDDVYVEVDVPPAHGDLVLNPDGSFTYTPHAGFFGTDTFTYFLNGIPDRTPYTDYATVTITVEPYMRIYMPLLNR